MVELGSNVVAFRARKAAGTQPKNLVEAVYAAGSLTLRADDLALKTAAVMLQALGFLVIEEILADGTPLSLRRGETRRAKDRPWRLSKPPYAGAAGVPDAKGLFIPSR